MGVKGTMATAKGTVGVGKLVAKGGVGLVSETVWFSQSYLYQRQDPYKLTQFLFEILHIINR
jgi:hypothetical protein